MKKRKRGTFKMKKLVIGIMIILMVLSFTGCEEAVTSGKDIEETPENASEANKEEVDYKKEIIGEWESTTGYRNEEKVVFTEWGVVYAYKNGTYAKYEYEITDEVLKMVSCETLINYDDYNNLVPEDLILTGDKERRYDLKGDYLFIYSDFRAKEYIRINNSQRTEEEKEKIQADKDSCVRLESLYNKLLRNEKYNKILIRVDGNMIITFAGDEVKFGGILTNDVLEQAIESEITDKESEYYVEPPKEDGKTGYRIKWIIVDGRVAAFHVMTV